METRPVLYIGNKNYSSWSLRAWLGLKVAGIDFEERLVPLRTDEWAAKAPVFSPTAKVPAFYDGTKTIWEALGILEYIADSRPDTLLWPLDIDVRAVARAVSLEMHGGFSALRTYMPMNCRQSLPGLGRADDVDKDIARIAGIFKMCRTQYGQGGDFLFGDFSIADAMYAPVVTRFKTYGVDLDPVGNAYMQAILDLPAMKEWYADAAAEEWVIQESEVK
ncbi:glutathione S-transferase family protein [Thalassospira sp.]|uniref:glutathione S-transferase family protein n=1 Tax=Thalassospira sp. TaxID=1912094 RepID=UPI000C427088|nr:glutathione S-transferase family protein [Thalassospira sp.]MAL38446.1 glutathione S-transferase [Thalassospira sp.]HAY48961.1 glutathione S-transferase [Thalassospira sp.]